MEQNMTTVVREIVNFCFDQRVESRLSNFVTTEHFKDKLKLKLDNASFFDHIKKRQEMESLDNREFKVAEKFH